ncbi:MAG: hypothetical protein HC796_03805 [Synechococcaceae cyanobacterium RL_1_2]|nr:hypothetical protein [Synechococcaceae cyanobacterium RL_1_2]
MIILLYIIGVWWYPKTVNYDPLLADNDPLRTSLNLGLYGFTFFACLTNWQNCLQLIKKDKILVSLVLLVLLSLLWSVHIPSTVDYMKGLVRITALAVYLASRFTIRQQLILVRASLLIAALLSLLMCIVFPDQGIQISWGNLDGWRGVFFHKNILGRSMAFGSGVWLLGAINNRNSGAIGGCPGPLFYYALPY